MTPGRRILFAMFAIALGLRLLYAAVAGTSTNVTPYPISHEYQVAAKMQEDISWIKKPITPRASAYSVLLAAAFRLTGVHLWTAIILGAILGAIAVLILYALGENNFGKGIGLLSALWLSIYVHHMHYASLVLRDVLASAVFLLLCYAVVRPFSRMRTAVWVGLIYAILVHIDPQYLLVLPVLALFFLFFATRHRLLNLQYMILFLSAAFVFSIPWTVRNYVVYRDFVPVALEATHYTRLTGGLPDEGEARRDKEGGQNRNGLVRNSIEFWRVVDLGSSGSSMNAGGQSEPAQNGWSKRHNVISLLNYGLLLPFFVLGVIMVFRNKHRAGIILTAAMLIYFLIRAQYGATERSRLPVEPIIILLAFYGIANLFTWIRKSKPTPSP